MAHIRRRTEHSRNHRPHMQARRRTARHLRLETKPKSSRPKRNTHNKRIQRQDKSQRHKRARHSIHPLLPAAKPIPIHTAEKLRHNSESHAPRSAMPRLRHLLQGRHTHNGRSHTAHRRHLQGKRPGTQTHKIT